MNIQVVLILYIFFIGGYDKIFYMDRVSVECYDSSIDDWTFVIEMEKVRFGFLLIVIDYNIYMIGGRYKIVDQYFDVVERYKVYLYSGFYDIVFIVKSEIIFICLYFYYKIFISN